MNLRYNWIHIFYSSKEIYFFFYPDLSSISETNLSIYMQKEDVINIDLVWRFKLYEMGHLWDKGVV
jgi:hypothetical protein